MATLLERLLPTVKMKMIDHTLAHTLALANCRILNIKTPKHKREQTYFNNNLLNLEEKKNTYRMA